MIPQLNSVLLPQIISDTSEKYYDSLEKLCGNIDRCLDSYENRELFIAHVNYTSLLAKEVKDFVTERRELYIPYMLELSEKSKTGHDCAHCSGQCDMQHTLRLVEFTSSLKKIQGTSSYIQQEFDASCNNNPDTTMIWLRGAVNLMVTILDGLFVQEESVLMPAIQHAQKNINAHS